MLSDIYCINIFFLYCVSRVYSLTSNMNLLKLPNGRIGCAGPFQETALLRIERPSIATVRHYYNDKNHKNLPLGDGMGSLEVTSSTTFKMPTAPIPRRHSAVVQKPISEQSSPMAIPGSIPAYCSDGICRASIISEEMTVRGLLYSSILLAGH